MHVNEILGIIRGEKRDSIGCPWCLSLRGYTRTGQRGIDFMEIFRLHGKYLGF